METWPHSTARAIAGGDIKCELIFSPEIPFHSWVLQGFSKLHRWLFFKRNIIFSTLRKYLIWTLEIFLRVGRNTAPSLSLIRERKSHKQIQNILMFSSYSCRWELRRLTLELHQTRNLDQNTSFKKHSSGPSPILSSGLPRKELVVFPEDSREAPAWICSRLNCWPPLSFLQPVFVEYHLWWEKPCSRC